MASRPPSEGTEAEGTRPPSPPVAADSTALKLSDLVGFYMQQSAAVNQLWAMYATTTFAAGVFAFTVGSASETPWLLVAGMTGFFFFTFGHQNMVRSSVRRLDCAAYDISKIADTLDPGCLPSVIGLLSHRDSSASFIDRLSPRGSLPSDDGPLPHRGSSVAGAMVVHYAIDLCVFAAFGVQLSAHLN